MNAECKNCPVIGMVERLLRTNNLLRHQLDGGFNMLTNKQWCESRLLDLQQQRELAYYQLVDNLGKNESGDVVSQSKIEAINNNPIEDIAPPEGGWEEYLTPVGQRALSDLLDIEREIVVAQKSLEREVR